MMYYSEHRDYPGAKEEFLKNYRPSAGMMFSEGIGAGFRDVSFMLMQSVMEMDKAENQPLLTKQDWEASKFFDEAIKWDDSFTTPKARLLKERRDRERELGFLLERAGAGATASFYAGALVGTVPDPVNYIPFVGIASKAKSAAVLGKIAQSGRLGRGATTAADAVLGTALIQPLVAAERDTYQLKYDTRDALTELGLALGLGFGLGAALGRVHPKDPDPRNRQEANTVAVNRQGEVEFKEEAPSARPTASERAWDSVDPVTKKQAVDAELASQSAGVQNRLPVPRQKGAEQAIAQQAARMQAAKEAFADSQIINSDGTPRVMYHGTGQEIKAFTTQNTRGGLIYFTPNADEASGFAAAKGSLEFKTDFQILAQENPGVFDLKTGKVLDARKLRKALKNDSYNYLDADAIAKNATKNKTSFAKEFERLYESNYQGDNVLPVYINAKKVLGSEDAPAMKWQDAEKLGSKHFKDKGYDAVWIEEGGQQKPSLAIFDPKLVKSIYNPGRFDFQKNELIPDKVWNTPRPALKELPPPDDIPISANESRLQEAEAKQDERIRTKEENDTLKEEDARAIAEIDEEVKAQKSFHDAVFEVTECMIDNG
jgi:hypothetical protein